MKNKIEILYWLIEEYGPAVVGVVGTAITIWLVLICKIPEASFEKILESTITLGSILIGFVGALLGILFSIRNSSIIQLLFKANAKDILKRYFKRTIISGMALVVISLFLYITSIISSWQYHFQYAIYGTWGFLLFFTLASTFRIINIMMHILFDDDHTDNEEPKSIKMSQEESDELKMRYKK